MKKAFVSGLIISFSFGVCAESVTNNLDVQGGFIYNHGMINPGDFGMTFTNAGIRDVTVSSGQLSGVDPETGEVITNALNLISLKAESLTTVSNITAGGTFIGDGSGITNLPVQAQLDALITVVSNSPAATITTNQIASWNSGGTLAANVQVSGGIVNVSTNLTVQGAVHAESISAAGPEGSFQFKQNGKLAGTDKLFIHEGTGKPAFYSENGNLFRAYKNGIVAETNLIYSLRTEKDEAVLRMFKDGVETVKIKGDGTVHFAGQLIADGSGLTNLTAQTEIADFITWAANSPASMITSNQIASLERIQLSGDTITVTTNLIVQGTLSGDGSGLTGVPASAGGTDGTIQFNDNGLLSGNPNFFIHPTEKKPAFRSPSGNFFRGYNSETISDNNLIYSLRNENGTSVLRMRENGQDKVVLKGDGSITFGGETRTTWPSGGGDSTNVVTTTFTYVPPQGDLAMGIYTNGVH